MQSQNWIVIDIGSSKPSVKRSKNEAKLRPVTKSQKNSIVTDIRSSKPFENWVEAKTSQIVSF